MHYANGQEAKAGDLVYKSSKYSGDLAVVGLLISATPKSQTCNGMMQPVLVRGESESGLTGWIPAAAMTIWSVTVGELLPVPMPMLPDRRDS